MSAGNPYDEPKDGDYVAYLAALERRQLSALAGERAKSPTSALPKAPAAATSAPKTSESAAGPLTREQAQQLLQQLGRVRDAAGRFDAAALVPGIIGLVLVLIGLALDGAWFFILIGAFLIYQMIRSLRRRAAQGSAAQQVSDLFDVHAWGASTQSNGSNRKNSNAKERR